MQCEDDFGAQGGDPRRMTGGVHIDLSTCVNFYGPPLAALVRLRTGVQPEDLQIHPYAAAERMEALYARHLGVAAPPRRGGRGPPA
jgi:histidinol-phosphate/aromatic aminotransferase/cobyric acid decarboxylase-like protein